MTDQKPLSPFPRARIMDDRRSLPIALLRAAALARRSYLLAPSLSRILKDLEAAGYVRRRPGDDDSRQSLLSLSPKGSATVTGAAPFLDRIHREIARRFGPDRVDELLALLGDLEHALADPPAVSRPVDRKTRRRQQ